MTNKFSRVKAKLTVLPLYFSLALLALGLFSKYALSSSNNDFKSDFSMDITILKEVSDELSEKCLAGDSKRCKQAESIDALINIISKQ